MRKMGLFDYKKHITQIQARKKHGWTRTTDKKIHASDAMNLFSIN